MGSMSQKSIEYMYINLIKNDTICLKNTKVLKACNTLQSSSSQWAPKAAVRTKRCASTAIMTASWRSRASSASVGPVRDPCGESDRRWSTWSAWMQARCPAPNAHPSKTTITKLPAWCTFLVSRDGCFTSVPVCGSVLKLYLRISIINYLYSGSSLTTTVQGIDSPVVTTSLLPLVVAAWLYGPLYILCLMMVRRLVDLWFTGPGDYLLNVSVRPVDSKGQSWEFGQREVILIKAEDPSKHQQLHPQRQHQQAAVPTNMQLPRLYKAWLPFGRFL